MSLKRLLGGDDLAATNVGIGVQNLTLQVAHVYGIEIDNPNSADAR